MNCKYTNDGKKVVVVGKLNATESIVQEIFVSNGGEIPSGEQFVTKTLHDAPAISWKEKRSKEIEAQLSKLQEDLNKSSKLTHRAMYEAGERVKALRIVASKATQESLQALEDFVSGRITHLVSISYGSAKITEFNEAITKREEFHNVSIKLLSLMGQADGTLTWRLHQYSDHSGSSEELFMAHSLEHAVAIAQKDFDEAADNWRAGKRSSPYCVDFCKHNGKTIDLKIPDDVIAFHEKRKSDEVARRIKTLESELAKLKGS